MLVTSTANIQSSTYTYSRLDGNKSSAIISVEEAKKLGIPVVAIVDTNSDPTIIDYPIPGNDDAIKSMTYIMEKIAELAKGSIKFISVVIFNLFLKRCPANPHRKFIGKDSSVSDNFIFG